MEFHFFNLEKLQGLSIKSENTKENKLINWLKFINATTRKERNMLATTSPVLAILNEQVGKLDLSPEEQYLYESRMKLRSDIVSIQESSFNHGITQGIEKGIEKGFRVKAIETAKKAQAMGLPIQTIIELTGLSEEEILKLK